MSRAVSHPTSRYPTTKGALKPMQHKLSCSLEQAHSLVLEQFLETSPWTIKRSFACVQSLSCRHFIKIDKTEVKVPRMKSASGKRIISGSRLKHSSIMQENRIWKQALIWHCSLYWCLLRGTWAPKMREELFPFEILIFLTWEKKCIEIYICVYIYKTSCTGHCKLYQIAFLMSSKMEQTDLGSTLRMRVTLSMHAQVFFHFQQYCN